MRKSYLVLALAMAVALAFSPGAAKAAGGGGGGSTSTGGGGGGGSAGLKTSIIVLTGGYYAPGSSGNTVAKGTATVSYDSTQTIRTVTVAVDNVNLPDGTVLNVVFTDNGLTTSTTYYGTAIVTSWVPQCAGVMVIHRGSGSLSISTANGDFVPLFGNAGSITVNTVDDLGNSIATALTGSYAPKGNKPTFGP